MGTFNVDVEIANYTGGEFQSINALVDTGSTHATVPASLLQRLGLYFPDQTDSSNHVTLWDGSNYKRAA